MRHLKMIPGDAPEPVACTLFEMFHWLRSEHDGFWYPRAQAGETVVAGQVLGTVQDWEGRVQQTGVSPEDGVVLFIVSSLTILVADPLFAVGV